MLAACEGVRSMAFSRPVCRALSVFALVLVWTTVDLAWGQAPPPPPPPPASPPKAPTPSSPPPPAEPSAPSDDDADIEGETDGETESETGADAGTPTQPPAPTVPTGEQPSKAATAPAGTGESGTPKAPDLVEANPAPEGPQAIATPISPVEGSAQNDDDGRKFIKGDLAHPGTRELLSRFDHIGVQVGPAVIAGDLFLSVDPGLAFYNKGWAFSLHAPLNLLVVENGTLEYAGMKVREQDWDEISDYARVIRFITIGRKEDPLYFSINSLRPTTLGHGLLIDKYQGNIDVDRQMTGVQFDATAGFGGFQFTMNDVTLNNQVLGAVAFIKPLGFFGDDWFSEGLSLGIEYAADLKAPRCVTFSEDSQQCVQASGHQAGNDPFSGRLRDDTFVRSDTEIGRYSTLDTTVQAVGFSGEVKLYKDEDNVDLKAYGTYHTFANEGGGSGLSGGLLARLNAGQVWRHAFRIRGEYRTFGDGFLPSYFDTNYEIAKYQSFYQPSAYQVNPTRYQRVFGDPENGFERESLDRRHGYNFEFSWGLFKNRRRNKKVAVAVGLSDSTGPYDSNAYGHVEIPALEILQVFGTYIRTNSAQFSDLFGEDMFTQNNSVVLTGLRLQILPILFINAHFSRSFATTRSPGQEYHLGDASIVDDAGVPSDVFVQDRLFENVSSFFVKLEFGWEFDDDEDYDESTSRSGVDDDY